MHLQTQITTNDPPETALTLARLRREGMSEDVAWRWLSAVLLQEMSIMIRDDGPSIGQGSSVRSSDRRD